AHRPVDCGAEEAARRDRRALPGAPDPHRAEGDRDAAGRDGVGGVRRLAAGLVAGFLGAVRLLGHDLAPDAHPEMTAAALAFLKTLRPELKADCLLPLPDPERLEWSYLPRERRRVSLKQMNDAERRAAHALLAASLSARGGEKAEGVLELEGILRGIEAWFGRDPQLYYVTIFGVPSPESAWAWRFEGHHLSLHFSS